jgi:hypothetical protein
MSSPKPLRLQRFQLQLSSLSEEHIPQANIRPTARSTHCTPRPRPTLLPHKRILLLTPSITTLRLNEQLTAMTRAKAARVLEEDVSLALRHFAEDDDVFWVLWYALALELESNGM